VRGHGRGGSQLNFSGHGREVSADETEAAHTGMPSLYIHRPHGLDGSARPVPLCPSDVECAGTDARETREVRKEASDWARS